MVASRKVKSFIVIVMIWEKCCNSITTLKSQTCDSELVVQTNCCNTPSTHNYNVILHSLLLVYILNIAHI